MKTTMPLVRNRFTRVRRTNQITEIDPALATQQQFKDECDMNRIVKNAARGLAPRFAQGTPHFADFTEVPDLMGYYQVIERAEIAFMSLPSGLRRELNNDPSRINTLTKDQIVRYKLGKVVPGPTPSLEEPPLPAGQGGTAGTEPAKGSKTPKDS